MPRSRPASATTRTAPAPPLPAARRRSSLPSFPKIGGLTLQAVGLSRVRPVLVAVVVLDAPEGALPDGGHGRGPLAARLHGRHADLALRPRDDGEPLPAREQLLLRLRLLGGRALPLPARERLAGGGELHALEHGLLAHGQTPARVAARMACCSSRVKARPGWSIPYAARPNDRSVGLCRSVW